MILERKKWSALNGTLIQICSFCHVCHMSIFPTFNFLGHESGRFSRDPQRSSDLRQAWRLPDAFECTHLVIGSLVCCSNLNSCHPICKLACFIADPPSFHIASISERERERQTKGNILGPKHAPKLETYEGLTCVEQHPHIQHEPWHDLTRSIPRDWIPGACRMPDRKQWMFDKMDRLALPLLWDL